MKFDSQAYFLGCVQEHEQALAAVRQLATPIQKATELLSKVLDTGNKIFLCGNGGSAADCQHLAAEFTGRFTKDRKPLAALALSTDTSALTCISNDYSFEDVFSRQLQGLGRPGDCLIGISTSGHSKNVIKAVHAASAMGIHTIGLLGRDGGVLSSLCDLPIVVPHSETARIQEMHILIGHSLCGAVERQLGLVPDSKG
jgi:D-sedoheptulose 7-phosphate isomerase